MRLTGTILSMIESHIPRQQLPSLPLRTIFDTGRRHAQFPPTPLAEFGSDPRRPQKGFYKVKLFKIHRCRRRIERLLDGSGADSALKFAISQLEAYKFTGPSTPRTLRRRDSEYSSIISIFLSHPNGLSSVASLLSRQAEEGIPVSPATLTSYLKLSMHRGIPSMQVVQNMLPLLPEGVDIHLLTTILRAMIREGHTPLAEIESLITGCLKLEGIEGREVWPWDLWDVLVFAHTKRQDLRSAVKLLGEFKQMVKNRKVQEGSNKSGVDIWTEEEINLICRPYTTFMTATHALARPGVTPRTGRKMDSAVPLRLAKDLAALLGGGQYFTVEFLNSWMTAERIAGNYKRSFSVWRLISGQENDLECAVSPLSSSSLPVAGKGAHSSSRFEIAKGLLRKPDSQSWIALFQLLKYSDIQRYTSLRPLVSNLLAQSRDTPSVITSPVINSLLSAVFQTPNPDLPLVLHILTILNTGSYSHLVPDTRTIDIVASSLIKLERSDERLRAIFAEDDVPRKVTRRHDRRGVVVAAGGVTPMEWLRLSKTLHDLRDDAKTSKDYIRLPLSLLLAEVDMMTTAERDLVKTQITSEIVVNSDGSRLKDRLTDHSKLVKPLIRLVERVLVLRMDDADMRSAYDSYSKADAKPAKEMSFSAWVLALVDETLKRDILSA